MIHHTTLITFVIFLLYILPSCLTIGSVACFVLTLTASYSDTEIKAMIFGDIYGDYWFRLSKLQFNLRSSITGIWSEFGNKHKSPDCYLNYYFWNIWNTNRNPLSTWRGTDRRHLHCLQIWILQESSWKRNVPGMSSKLRGDTRNRKHRMP